MSKQTNNISIQGTVSNLLDEGFDLISSIKEITDNSFGAGAKQIKIFLNMKTITLYIMDDGYGMNKWQLTKLATLNDRKEVSREKQGKYGQGVKLSLAYLTQNKYLITIVSKTKDHGPKEDDLNQIEINFAESIQTGEYNPRAERVSGPNEELWHKLSMYFGVDNLEMGTLIEIKMDKKKFKELYTKITTNEISQYGNILYEMGVINQIILKNPEYQITFHLQQVVEDNEPPLEDYKLDIDEDGQDQDDYSNDELTNDELTNDDKYDEHTWDVNCSEEYVEPHLRVPSINLLDNSEEIQEHDCVIFDVNGDKKILLKKDDTFYEILPENLRNLSKKIKTYTRENVEKITKNNQTFKITLAHNSNWTGALQNELIQITKCIPPLKSTTHSKLLSHVKGHYYFRDGICSLNSRLRANHTQGGDRAQRKFEENIIAFIKYSSSLDKQFGVTVKKYSSIEEIVDSRILTIIYYLKKRWATDYNNNRKKTIEEEQIRLNAIAFEQEQSARIKEEQDRLNALQKQEEQLRLKEKEEQDRLIALQKKQEQLRLKEKEEQDRLIALQKQEEQEQTARIKEEQDRLIALQKQQEQLRLKEKEEQDILNALQKQQEQTARLKEEQDRLIALQKKQEQLRLKEKEEQDILNALQKQQEQTARLKEEQDRLIALQKQEQYRLQEQLRKEEQDRIRLKEKEEQLQDQTEEAIQPQQLRLEPEEPKQILRSSSTTLSVQKGKFIDCLNEWANKKCYIDELEEIVNFMCKEYELYKPSIFKMAITALTLEQKIQQLTVEINAKYTSDKEQVLCGSDFYRVYEKYIK